ncbi:MAG: cupin domain-containing protein [Acidobacteriota bacterium]
MPRRKSQPHPQSPGLNPRATAAGPVAPLGARTIVMGSIVMGTLVMAAIVVAALARPSTVAAGEGDATKKLVLQNERVRAVANYYPGGASVAEHEHTAPRAVVVIEGGTLEIRDANGKVSTLSLRNGDIVWRPPEKHSIVNVGSTPVRVVEIDILDCPKR